MLLNRQPAATFDPLEPLLEFAGDVVVDTFALPSACVCHFRESPLAAPQIDLSTRLGGAANADTGAKDKAEGRGADDGEEEADDPRCVGHL